MLKRIGPGSTALFFSLATFVFLSAVAMPHRAVAQKKPKTPVERTIAGVVMTADETPVPGAVVQLKNLKTQQIRSYIARDKGDYIYQGLSMDVDYELKAMANGKESAPRTVSTFDPHTSVTLNLKLKQ